MLTYGTFWPQLSIAGQGCENPGEAPGFMTQPFELSDLGMPQSVREDTVLTSWAPPLTLWHHYWLFNLSSPSRCHSVLVVAFMGAWLGLSTERERE